jgi:hypothetical protein
MRIVHYAGPWVVYERWVKGQPSGINVVCDQAEWDALEAERPGVHTLVRSGIATEGEAERHARAATPALLSGPRKYR